MTITDKKRAIMPQNGRLPACLPALAVVSFALMPENNAEQSRLIPTDGLSLKEIFFSARRHYPELNEGDLAVPATPKGFKITESIYLSHWIPAHNPDFIKTFGIRSILCLDGKLKPDWAPLLGVDKIISMDIPDGPEFTKRHLLEALRGLESLASRHAPVLVSCHAGQSRSPAVVIGYIAVHAHLSVKEALALVRRERAAEREIKIWPSMQKALKEVVAR